MSKTPLHYGCVGGDLGAFIGSVHRHAIALDEQAVLSAGCFSTQEEKNFACAKHYGLPADRTYANYIEMAERECLREDKIDFVVIATPNVTHYEIAKKFLECGFHVACEKPLCLEVSQAKELEQLAQEKGLLFAVTYTYVGYAMVKQAKELIDSGVIGNIININAEYLQEWLIDEVGGGDQSTTKLSVWRTDPAKSGISNCVGDIGTHIESLVSYLIGSKLKRVAAKCDCYGMDLDLNANMLVEYENGTHGVFSCSQVCVGHYNGLVVRIFGSKGAIEWVQEDPDRLFVTLKGQPIQIYTRGTGNMLPRCAAVSHIPSGHPEGLTMAFTNIYHAFINAIDKLKRGEALSEKWDRDFPNVSMGVEGVKFIHAVIQSSQQDAAWVNLE